MGDDIDAERERLLAEYERLTGSRPLWMEIVKNEGIAWHIEQLKGEDDEEEHR